MEACKAIRWLAAGALALAPAAVVRAQVPQASADIASEALPPVEQAVVTPARPPRVTCEHNQLFVAADDSTLSSVLAAVSTCLNIAIRTPAGFTDERTFTHLGPGPVNRVLDDLLGSTDLNYAMVFAGSDGARVTRVVLTSRAADAAESKGEETGTTGSGAAMTSARRLWIASQNSSGRPATETSEQPGRDADPVTATTPATRGIPEKLATAAASAPSAGDPAAATPGGYGAERAAPSDAKDDAGAASAAVPAPPATSPSPDPTAPPPAPTPQPSADATKPQSGTDNGLGQQINQMQQMFDQRRKLNNSATPTPDPQ